MKHYLYNVLKIFTLQTFVVFLALGTFSGELQAKVRVQGNKIWLDVKDTPIKSILKELENKSTYTFFYSDDQIDVTKKISIKVEGETITEILPKLFNPDEVTWSTVGNKIVLSKQKKVQNPNNFKVSGAVLDGETGEPIPGVSILIKGSTVGTISDFNGKFTIEVPNENSILLFSFMGYALQEVAIEGRTEITVRMQVTVETLEEVVVVGYGTESKKLISGSLVSVSGESLQNSISNGIEDALQGKTSGVQIVQNSGTPGGAMTVNIRGKSSISAGTQPLYVIDGIPMTTGNFGQIGFEGQGIDAASDISPNNIESITILKDASAAAIYGARAGNGVILITTKTGAKNKTAILYKSFFGVQKVYKKLDLLNADEWKEFVASFDPAYVASLPTGINTNWQDSVFRIAPISDHELSFSGGEKNTRFYISGRYFTQDGIVLGSGYEKWTGQISVDHDLSKKFRIGAKLNINYSINDRIVGDQSINGVLPNAISKPPIYAVRDQYGNYLEEGFWDNPVAIGNEVTNQAKTLRNISNIFAEYDIIPGLSVKNQWGFDFYNLDERRYEPTTVDRGSEANGIAIAAQTNVFKLTQQTILKYVKTFGRNHNFDALTGFSFEKESERNSFIRGNNFPSDELEYLVSAGTIESASSNGYNFAMVSYFGRAKYNYADKYIITLTGRGDGSSNFGTNNRFAFLPSVAVAWRLSDEAFIKNLNFFNELKLKFSYGLTGNDRIGAFRSLNLYSSGYNYKGKAGIIPTQIPNPDLKWETTTNYNTGVEFAILKNRLSVSFDAYYNKTTDLLLNRPLPGSSGFSSVSANVGALENKGLELAVATENFTGKFIWSTEFNFSLNRNKVLELYKNQPITDVGRGGNSVIVGYPLGVFYMYKSLGVDPSTGDLVFEDVNKDGAITDADRTVVADPNPKFVGGLTNTFGLGGFTLRVFFNYSVGNYIFNGTRQYAESMKFGINDNQLATIKDRWQKPGDRTYVPRFNGTNNLFPISSHYIENGSYLRLREVTLSYNFSKEIMDKIPAVSGLQLYLKAQNIYTLTPYSGMDPDVNYSGANQLSTGTDFFTFPQPMSFSAGIKLNF